MSSRRRRIPLPLPMQRRSTDEFAPVAYGRRDLAVLAETLDATTAAARRLGLAPEDAARSRLGTAAALRAINRAWGTEYYAVPEEATRDPDAADAALGGDQLVFDVQTHYVARERAGSHGAGAVLEFIRSVAPERWKGLAGAAELGLAEYLRCVFLESETALAVLTSTPGEAERNILSNAEIAATRELVERLGGGGRLLHHAIVHPNVAGELEGMARVAERCRPVAWKVYTLYGGAGEPLGSGGWRLDDPRIGEPFLRRSRELGVRVVCAHKGLSALAPGGSPEDVGPAAAAHPEISFLIYHSGYEAPRGDEEEGAYAPDGPAAGSDRLVRSLEGAGVGPGANVYAELGSTWFILMRRPREAAHVLGKLLRAVGEDNVLWGTDSVWYGSPQPLIDGFRAFQIPPELCERHGYPALTARVKEKILGLNAARVYGVDVERARRAAREDDLAWVRDALAHARTRGTPTL